MISGRISDGFGMFWMILGQYGSQLPNLKLMAADMGHYVALFHPRPDGSTRRLRR